jgi:hypothetical protein
VPVSIDQPGDDGVVAHVDDRLIRGRGRLRDGINPFPNHRDVGVRLCMSGAYIKEFSGVNDLRFWGGRLLCPGI